MAHNLEYILRITIWWLNEATSQSQTKKIFSLWKTNHVQGGTVFFREGVKKTWLPPAKKKHIFQTKWQKILTCPETFFVLKPFFCIVAPVWVQVLKKIIIKNGRKKLIFFHHLFPLFEGQSLGDLSLKSQVFLLAVFFALP